MVKMVRMLGLDLRKLFGDYHIYICTIGLAFLYLLVHIQTIDEGSYEFGVVNAFSIVADGSDIMLISFLLSIVGGSFLYCAEEKHGYLVYEIQRIGVSVFTISKLLASIIGGFFTVLVGNILFFAGIILHRFFTVGIFTFEGENIEFMIWIWLFSSLRCGVLSAIGFLVTTYVANYYIGMTIPLLIYYGILQIQHWISIFYPFFPSEFYFSKIYMGSYGTNNDLQRFVFALLYTACISVIMYRMAKKRIERRLEHA